MLFLRVDFGEDCGQKLVLTFGIHHYKGESVSKKYNWCFFVTPSTLQKLPHEDFEDASIDEIFGRIYLIVGFLHFLYSIIFIISYTMTRRWRFWAAVPEYQHTFHARTSLVLTDISWKSKHVIQGRTPHVKITFYTLAIRITVWEMQAYYSCYKL